MQVGIIVVALVCLAVWGGFFLVRRFRSFSRLEREFLEDRKTQDASRSAEWDDETLSIEGMEEADGREKELFERINRKIIEQRLFLDPNFSRETFMELGLMNRNKAARILKKYAGTNLSGYINSLRLEYAARLIQEHPDTQIKTVAIESGFSNVRTFYRLFLDKYGVTASEYKEKSCNCR